MEDFRTVGKELQIELTTARDTLFDNQSKEKPSLADKQVDGRELQQKINGFISSLLPGRKKDALSDVSNLSRQLGTGSNSNENALMLKIGRFLEVLQRFLETGG